MRGSVDNFTDTTSYPGMCSCSKGLRDARGFGFSSVASPAVVVGALFEIDVFFGNRGFFVLGGPWIASCHRNRVALYQLQNRQSNKMVRLDVELILHHRRHVCKYQHPQCVVPLHSELCIRDL